jgi:ParB family chromosome partitioning protein
MAQNSKAARRRLGRGLGALITAPIDVPPPSMIEPKQAPPESPAPAQPGEETPYGLIPVASICPNPRQPRQDFDEASLGALAESIRLAGLMQPVIVRPAPEPGMYELVAGERRWRAVRLLGLESIPTLVRSLDDLTADRWALIENLQREDLNPMERAEAFSRLIDRHALSHQDVAESVGLDRSTVTNILRLLELEPEIQGALRTGSLTMGHAKALLSFTNIKDRRRMSSLAIRNKWSVRELERRATARHTAPTPPGPEPSVHLRDLERRLGDHLGTRVAIHAGAGKGRGRISLEFYSHEQFQGLLRRMQFDPSA